MCSLARHGVELRVRHAYVVLLTMRIIKKRAPIEASDRMFLRQALPMIPQPAGLNDLLGGVITSFIAAASCMRHDVCAARGCSCCLRRNSVGACDAYAPDVPRIKSR